MVKSEIVVPVLARRKFVALIDIQSYFVDTFKASEEQSFCRGMRQDHREVHGSEAVKI
jgi:putative methionine-R-sulfoxide reductase with GAF domain